MDCEEMEALRNIVEYVRQVATHPAHEDLRDSLKVLDVYLDGDQNEEEDATLEA